MSKRFSDTEKWRDPWFSELPSPLKLFWIYLLDICNHGGIWKMNRRLAEFEIGEKIEWGSEPDFIPSFFKDRIESKDGYWFIPKFLRWQYGEKLNKGDAFSSALQMIESKGFYESVERVYGPSLDSPRRAKAKAKAKAIAKASLKEGVQGEKKTSQRFEKPTAAQVTLYARSIGFNLDGQKFWDYYESKGWVVGKAAMKSWQAAVRTWKSNEAGPGSAPVMSQEERERKMAAREKELERLKALDWERQQKRKLEAQRT